jgi:hypothetical protein
MPSRAVQHQGLAFDEKAVFLNFPYDASYERVFLALLAVLLSLGRKPRCTFEIADVGQGRVSRIFDRLESSAVSIHDLSRVGSPARFNMPWELGLADAMRRYWGQHDVIVLERVPRRLKKTLSDRQFADEKVHGGDPYTAIVCILDALGSSTAELDPEHVYRRVFRPLCRAARELKRKHRRKNVFHAAIYRQLVVIGTEKAAELSH